jgi:hypothetical protein
VAKGQALGRYLLVAVIMGLAFVIGAILSGLSAGAELVILFAVAVTVAAGAFVMRARSSVIGNDIGPSQYLGVCFLTVATLLITFNAVRATSFLTISDVALLGAVVFFCLAFLSDRAPVPVVPAWLVIGAVGLLVAGFLASFRANNYGGDVVASSEFAIALLGVPVLVGYGSNSAARLRFFSRVWLFSALLNAAVALTDFSHMTSIGLVASGRPAGLTVHPNHLGMICAMSVPIGLFLAISSKKPLHRVGYLSVLVIVSLGVLVSGSRAALLAAVAGTVLLPILGRGLWKPVVTVALVASALMLASSWNMSPESASPSTNPFVAIGRLTNEAAISESDTARLSYYAAALQDFADHPLTGVGFDVVRGAHDIYLQLLQAGGILAFASFAVFAVGSIGLGLRVSRDLILPGEMRNLAAALTASVLVWLLASLVQNFVYDRFLYVPIGLLIGLGTLRVRRAGTRHAGKAVEAQAMPGIGLPR